MLPAVAACSLVVALAWAIAARLAQIPHRPWRDWPAAHTPWVVHRPTWHCGPPSYPQLAVWDFGAPVVALGAAASLVAAAGPGRAVGRVVAVVVLAAALSPVAWGSWAGARCRAMARR